MTPTFRFALTLALGLNVATASLAQPHHPAPPEPSPPPRGPVAPVSQASFTITLDAPIGAAMAAFGPVGEGGWATGWAPRYFGRSGPDIEPDFAVFEASQALWVLADYDRKAHHLQYVTVHPDVAVTVIDITCTAIDAGHTRATVVYRRTGLGAASGPSAEAFVEHIAGQGPHWQAGINAYLKSRGP